MRSSGKSGKKYSRGFLASFNFAVEGIAHILRHERNMRIHFLAAFLGLIFGVYINLSPVEFMLLCVAICFVLITEMFNTAVERAIDLIEENYHPMAKMIKDVSAGAVFVSVVNALVVGYLLVSRQIDWESGALITERFRQSPWHLTLISLIAVTGLVLFVKVIRREKLLLRGGMPSGHSALAFAVWVSVSMITANLLASFLVLLIAAMLARSRISAGVHDLWEVVAGGLLGVFTTLLVFQVLL